MREVTYQKGIPSELKKDFLIYGGTLYNTAEAVRTLTGTTTSMTPVVMASKVDEANAEVSTQANLITQIANALDGKAVGGGASSNWSETIVTYTSAEGDEPGIYFWTLNVSGIDLSGKKCVLVTDVSTEMVIAVILTRDSVEDDFILKSASISTSAAQSSIGATQWIICTGYSRLELDDNMTLKIKAI